MADPIPYFPADPGSQPPLRYDPFVTTIPRSPMRPRIHMPQTLTETTGPSGKDVWGRLMGPAMTDLTHAHGGEAQGQRIIVSGCVVDENGRPAPDTVVEMVQASATGRYAHLYDQYNAPLDPYFTGVGRAITDAEGRYEFLTVKPAPYPWANGKNTWRPSHIHFSLLGPAFATRLVTQMYFPGEPLNALDAIFCSVPEAARSRLVAALDMDKTRPHWALAYNFDFVLRGRNATPTEN